MRTIIAALGILALAGSSAWADFSDNGLITSSNVILLGTMTVQGAGPYSIVTSSTIQIQAGGIKWPDGSVSTSAAVSGGNMSTGGANTMAANSSITMGNASQFALAAGSTMTAGPSNYSTSLAITGVKSNDWNTVAVSTFSNASSLNFTGFISTTTYRAWCHFYQRTDAQNNGLQMQFSGDTGAHYGEACHNVSDNIGASNNCSVPNFSGTQIDLVHSTLGPSAGSGMTLLIDDLTTVWEKIGPHIVQGLFRSGNRDNTNNRNNSTQGSFNYNGSNGLTSVRIFTSGTFDGICVWQAFILNTAIPAP